MRSFAALLIAAAMASFSAVAGETNNAPQSVPYDLAPHSQPSEKQLQQLPAAERQGLSVDFSSRDADEVQQLYQELAHTGGAPRQRQR